MNILKSESKFSSMLVHTSSLSVIITNAYNLKKSQTKLTDTKKNN